MHIYKCIAVLNRSFIEYKKRENVERVSREIGFVVVVAVVMYLVLSAGASCM